MNLEKLTNKSREALLNSRQIAVSRHHNELRVLHVLAALLADDNGLVRSIFDKCGVNCSIFENTLNGALSELPRISGDGASDIYNSREFSELLSDASRHAENMKDEYISVEHLLLAIFNSKSRARELLENSGSSGMISPESAAGAACKAAVKAHEQLALPAMNELLAQLRACRQGTLCPHGRPTMFELPLKEIERRFGRR